MVEVEVGEQVDMKQSAGTGRCLVNLSAMTATISIAVRTSADSEQLAMRCRLDIRQTWVCISVQLLTVWPGANHLPSLSWFPRLQRGGHTAGPQKPSFHSNIDEMPEEFNSCLY